MSGQPSLKHALGEIEKLALAPLMRSEGSRPKDVLDRRYPDWAERRIEIEKGVAEALADLGAFVMYGGAVAARLSYAGIESSSSMGLLETVRSWRRIVIAKINRETER